jgi:hypothetical protein
LAARGARTARHEPAAAKCHVGRAIGSLRRHADHRDPEGNGAETAATRLARARRSPNKRRFELTDMSVALLRNEAPGEVKITFAGHVSALGWRPESDPKLEVIIRTRGGASIYSWTFDFSVRCADTNRPVPPISQLVPNDIAANLFNSVGTVEISEYREPNSPILTARQCPS